MSALGSSPIGSVRPETVAKLAKLTGHDFQNLERLDRALTHSSARARTGSDYERLEFLGDRVLGICVAEMLFREYQTADEGELSVRLNALVNANTLAEVADELSLHSFIRAGADVAELKADRQKNLRADVVEALIAAIYLEGGLEAARAFILKYWAKRSADVMAARRDPKTELQEWCHRIHHTNPQYSVISRDGPDHEPVFTVKVAIGKDLAAVADGASKRLAEQAAAKLLLEVEGVWAQEETA